MSNQQKMVHLEETCALTHCLTAHEIDLLEKTMHMLRQHDQEYLFLKKLLGFHVDEIGNDRVTVSLPIQDSISNGKNMVHGGIIAALADATMGVLAAKLAGDEKSAVTSNLSVSYIATGRGHRLIAHVQAVHVGRKSFVMECTIVNDTDKLVARAGATFFIVPKGY